MYELKIETGKADIIAEVNKTCAYTGARTIAQDGKNLYNNISTDKYTAEMLERFWNEACALVVQAGKDFVKETSVDDDGFAIAYTLPDKYNTALDGSVRQLMFSYTVWYILANWLEVCGMSALAQSYGATAQMFLKQLDNLLYSRTAARADIAAGAEGGNEFGDEVDGFSQDDDGSGETEGGNEFGDEVDGFSQDDDGSGETEGGNEFGGVLPQNYGETHVEVYHFN